MPWRRESSMSKPEQHASPESLLGQLQRGRGEGFVRILSTPKGEACRLLLECITNDPRLDSQVEHRAENYASIAVKLGLDLAPLAQHLREHDDAGQSGWNTPLTVGTLKELAKRRFGNAADILCDYVAWGQWWDWPLHDLMALPDSDLHIKIAGAIERHFPSDKELENALAWFDLDDLYWATLAQHSKRISKFRNNPRKKFGAASLEDTSPPNLTSLTTKQLLELADDKNCHKLGKVIIQRVSPSDVDLLMENISIDKPFVAVVALEGLAQVAPERIFGWLQNFWSSNSEMKGFLRRRTIEVMVSLPHGLTLPLAHERLFHENWHERFLAEELFKAHASGEDIPVLKVAIKQALDDDEEYCYRLCNLVKAFSHLPDVGPIPELSDVFVQFRYSYGRTLAANAINVTAPGLFREKFAAECLWDCQDRTRALGAKFSPGANREVNVRLHELALDIWEDKSVREEAEKRIATAPLRILQPV
jgi:hypothetical protein